MCLTHSPFSNINACVPTVVGRAHKHTHTQTCSLIFSSVCGPVWTKDFTFNWTKQLVVHRRAQSERLTSECVICFLLLHWPDRLYHSHTHGGAQLEERESGADILSAKWWMFHGTDNPLKVHKHTQIPLFVCNQPGVGDHRDHKIHLKHIRISLFIGLFCADIFL